MGAPSCGGTAPQPSPRFLSRTEQPRFHLQSRYLLQRVNGRVAMIGFVSILGPEFAKKQPVLEQLGGKLIRYFWETLMKMDVLVGRS